MNKTFGSFRPQPSLLHPLEMMALTPHARTALSSMSVIFVASSITMLPKPMYTGVDPLSRNF